MNKKFHRRIIWCHSHFLNWMGGSKFIFEVVKRLSKNHEVIVVASVFSSEARHNFASIGIKTISLGTQSTNSALYWLNLKGNIYSESKRLRKIVGKDDVIISSMFPMNCVAEQFPNFHIECLWEPYSLFHDKNYVSGFGFFQRIFISLVSLLYMNLEEKATKKADRIITLSKYNKEWIQKVYGRCDSLISYEGVDTSFFKKTDNPILKERYKGKKIIFHSTDFTSIKGTKYLIDAFPKVLAVFPDTKLLISNTIDNPVEKRRYLNLARKLGFIGNIEFLGKVDYKLLPAYYSLANVVAQPSIEQNMSLPVKEAMACETPIITLKEGYEQTPNGKAGLLVRSDKPPEIASAIKKIFKDKENSEEMGKRGRKIILTKFTWDSVTGVFDRLITSAIGKIE